MYFRNTHDEFHFRNTHDEFHFSDTHDEFHFRNTHDDFPNVIHTGMPQNDTILGLGQSDRERQ